MPVLLIAILSPDQICLENYIVNGRNISEFKAEAYKLRSNAIIEVK